jgi:hypothetical protein
MKRPPSPAEAAAAVVLLLASTVPTADAFIPGIRRADAPDMGPFPVATHPDPFNPDYDRTRAAKSRRIVEWLMSLPDDPEHSNEDYDPKGPVDFQAKKNVFEDVPGIMESTHVYLWAFDEGSQGLSGTFYSLAAINYNERAPLQAKGQEEMRIKQDFIQISALHFNITNQLEESRRMVTVDIGLDGGINIASVNHVESQFSDERTVEPNLPVKGEEKRFAFQDFHNDAIDALYTIVVEQEEQEAR